MHNQNGEEMNKIRQTIIGNVKESMDFLAEMAHNLGEDVSYIAFNKDGTTDSIAVIWTDGTGDIVKFMVVEDNDSAIKPEGNGCTTHWSHNPNCEVCIRNTKAARRVENCAHPENEYCISCAPSVQEAINGHLYNSSCECEGCNH